jgi:colanic acid/amylovoran biosynthesis protein
VYIEIAGTGNHNKGAEMMLLTILENIDVPKATFVYQPSSESGQYAFYSKLGLHPKFSLSFKGIKLDWFLELIPKRLRLKYGLILESEIDFVLDASGFAYSEQWGDRPTVNLSKKIAKMKKGNKNLILMPQAFGPFESKKIRLAIKEVVKNTNLMFARDKKSFDYLSQFATGTNLFQAPDFTCILKSEKPEYFDSALHQACVVVNARMLDKLVNGDLYFGVLIHAIGYIQSLEMKPFFLVHGGREDLELAELINQRLASKIPILVENDPRLAKGILKSVQMVFGSRYHALVSSLSAGVITFGLGWSHKYEALFEDYDFPQGLLNVESSKHEIVQCLEILKDQCAKDDVISRLVRSKSFQIAETKKMFNKVNAVLKSK